jgi:hypothetical protein
MQMWGERTNTVKRFMQKGRKENRRSGSDSKDEERAAFIYNPRGW